MATLNPVRPATGYPSHPPPLEHGGASLGEWLKRTREQQGLTLDRLVSETKIPRRHLEALEHDNLKAIPGGIYQRAEIRAVARSLGLDQDRALALLESALHPATPVEKPREIPLEPPSGLPRRYALIAFVVIAVAATPLWRTFFRQAPAATSAPAARNSQAAALPAASQPIEEASGAPATPRSTAAADSLPLPLAVPLPLAPTATTAPIAPAAVTELVITTQPAGARVTVDGIGWGTSPVTIRYLSPGDKRIRVSKEGYGAEERSLRLAQGQPQTVEIPLGSTR